jgi:hypothetical protein
MESYTLRTAIPDVAISYYTEKARLRVEGFDLQAVSKLTDPSTMVGVDLVATTQPISFCSGQHQTYKIFCQRNSVGGRAEDFPVFFITHTAVLYKSLQVADSSEILLVGRAVSFHFF